MPKVALRNLFERVVQWRHHRGDDYSLDQCSIDSGEQDEVPELNPILVDRSRSFRSQTPMRDESLVNQLRTGAHSPARYRVLGPLAHMTAFAEAFNCPADAAMLRPPAERVTIW